MSLWDNTPLTLTTFTPLSSDVQPAGNFLSRWFRRGKDDSEQSSEGGSAPSSREVSVERGVPREQSLDRNKGSGRDSLSSASLKDREQDDSEGSQNEGREDEKEDTQTEGQRSSGVQKRTLRSVIASLSNILDRRTPTPQVYRDSDFKQYWMPDRSCRECYDCGDKFTTFRRRHHCRICGQIFCNACCNQELPGKIIGFKGSIRVCTYCCDVVQKYAQKADPLADPKVTKEALDRAYRETDRVTSPELGAKGQRKTTLDLHGPGSLRSPGESESGPTQDGSAPFDLTPQSEFVTLENFSLERRMLIQDSVQLRNLWSLMLDAEKGVEVQSYRLRLRTYQKCIMGNRLVDWLLKQDKVANRIQALAIGQALIDADYLEPIGNITTPFRDDFTLYKPTEMSLSDALIPPQQEATDTLPEDSAPQWFQDIVSNVDDDESISEEQNLRALLDSASLSIDRATSHSSQTGGNEPVQQETEEPLPQQNAIGSEDLVPGPIFRSEKSNTDYGSWRMLDSLSEDNLEKQTFNRLQRTHHDHLTMLTKQLLCDDSLPPSWADIITATVDRVSLFVKPDIREGGDDIDIRHYVHIKKVPGGSREQTSLVHGVIFTKNVAHKKMAQQINSPKTLLLNGSIEYQRVENKLSSLQPQILQEEEFLQKSIEKIVALKPDVVIVEKSVSRLAQDFLLKSGITLIYNVKLSVMERLSRFLQADIVPSIDTLVSGPRLGFSPSFSVRSYTLPTGDQKNMIVFDACATHLGCAITLRGGSLQELKRVKKVMNFMIYASYHSRLEVSFCMDEFMLPPPLADEIDWELSPKGLIDSNENEALLNGKPKVPSVQSKDGSFVENGENESTVLEQLSDCGKTIIVNKSGRERTASFVSFDEDMTELSAHDTDIASSHNSECSSSVLPTDTTSSTVFASETKGKPGDTHEVTERDDKTLGEHSLLESGANTKEITSENSFNCDKKSSEIQTVQCDSNQSDSEISSTELKSSQSEIPLKVDVDQTETVLRKNGNTNFTNKDPSESGKERFCSRRDSEVTQLTDYSDPLHNYQKNQDESIFHGTLPLEEQRQSSSHELRKALDSIVLSASPYIQYDLPYLVSEKGLKCELRKYFPQEIYWSSHFGPKGRGKKFNELEGGKKTLPTNIEILDAHQLIRCTLNKPVNDKAVQMMLAEFRAYGGRINVLKPGSQSLHLAGDKSSRRKENQSSKGRQLEGEGTQGKEHFSDNFVLWERKIDCLDPYRHQRIAVLFSSYSYHSSNHPNPCVSPWVVTMEFYGRNDITLGGFLERFCFRQSYVCPSDACDTPMLQHIRRFAHGKGSISVVLKQLDSPIVNGQTNILIWSWCHRCKQVTPVVPLSTDSWNMSFAKYLEIRFHGNQFRRRASAEPCSHSLHHDHFQYFGYKDIVASFKYSPIRLKEIKLPPFEITRVALVEQIQLYRLKDEAKRLSNKATDLYSTVLDCVLKMKAESQCEILSKQVANCVSQQQVEKNGMRDLAHEIRENLDLILGQEDTKIRHLTPDQNHLYQEAQDNLVVLKKAIVDAINSWNTKLQDLYVQQKKTKQITSQRKEKEKDSVPVSGSVEKEADDKISVSSLPRLQDTVMPSTSPSRVADRGTDNTMGVPIMLNEDQLSVDVLTSPGSSSQMVVNFDDSGEFSPVAMETQGQSQYNGEISSQVEEQKGQRTCCGDVGVTKPDAVMAPVKADVPADSGKKVVPVLEDQVDNQSGDKMAAFKKTLMNTIWQPSGAFQLNAPFDPCEHHQLPACERVPVVVYDHEPSSIIAFSLSCHDYQMKLHEIQTSYSSQKESASASGMKNVRSETDMSAPMLGRDEENTESSKKSMPGKVSFIKGNPKEANLRRAELLESVRYKVPKMDGENIESPVNTDDVDGFSIFSTTAVDNAEKSKTGKQTPNFHIELQFSDNTARFYCKAYFAEQFRQLRKLIFPAGEDMYIRSLSRCKPWEAKGGKSGSSFCKTDDDRFILKQMSGMEVESFEKFGPHYFQYISKSQTDQHPTALAKIVGVYRIGFRNQHTNNAMKQDVLVVENLFYNRQISQTFDLKGSMRNRLVSTNRKRDEEQVLLDENFLRVSVDCPLYIRPHSKTVLTLAISNDSKFLSSHLVMDYSLLVGLDEQKKELVVGIIDYIRTFTWDKKLEMAFKSFGGTGKQLPTVVSPELYRTRFLEAMGKYFLPVPDQWSGLGRDIDN